MEVTTAQANQLLKHLDQSARFIGQALAQGGLNNVKQCSEAIGNAIALADVLHAGIQADSAPEPKPASQPEPVA